MINDKLTVISHTTTNTIVVKRSNVKVCIPYFQVLLENPFWTALSFHRNSLFGQTVVFAQIKVQKPAFALLHSAKHTLESTNCYELLQIKNSYESIRYHCSFNVKTKMLIIKKIEQLTDKQLRCTYGKMIDSCISPWLAGMQPSTNMSTAPLSASLLTCCRTCFVSLEGTVCLNY